MTKRIRSISLALAASLPLCAMFAVPAYAEDTGLINALNAQTRAQVEAYKALAEQKRRESQQGPGGLGTGIRG